MDEQLIVDGTDIAKPGPDRRANLIRPLPLTLPLSELQPEEPRVLSAIWESLVKENVGTNWVPEIVLPPAAPSTAVETAINIARKVGRPLRVDAPADPAALPKANSGERWRRQGSGVEVAWILENPRPRGWQRVIKRTLDIVVAGTGILLLSPFLVAIAVAVRLSSPGPVLYPWRVRGLYGKPLTGYKFRSMVVDADGKREALKRLNEMRGPVFKMVNDPRMTGLGRWLRKYSLDELPQLFSVIKGDLSLVGPRPSFPSEYARFDLWQLRKLSVMPGITCLWQVNGRNKIHEFEEWVRLDLEYIDNWSIQLDLRIMLLTILAVIRGTGR